MRWTAPADTSAITLSLGLITVVEGVAETPDDLGDGDRAQLVHQGFRPAPAVAAPGKPDPVKPVTAPIDLPSKPLQTDEA